MPLKRCNGRLRRFLIGTLPGEQFSILPRAFTSRTVLFTRVQNVPIHCDKNKYITRRTDCKPLIFRSLTGAVFILHRKMTNCYNFMKKVVDILHI